MRSLLSRLVGRLPVGRKLLLIYLLDLTAVIYISVILINEKFLAINFARKEIQGNAYISEIRDALVRMPVPLKGLPVAALPADLGKPLAKAHQAHGEDMKADDTAQSLAQALAAKDAWDLPHYQLALDASRSLITRLGNQSNLILDPDLDSYYTMSLVVLRFPELLEVLAHTAQKSVEFDTAPPAQRARLRTELLILEGQLDGLTKGIFADYDEAFAANGNGLQERLKASHAALTDALARIRHSGERQEGAFAGKPVQAVREEHQRIVQELNRAWQAAGENLDGMLDQRIDQLFQRMWLHLGTAAALLLVILSLVYFVAGHIARPIRRLAGVADKVSRSGDYSLRAKHDSGDEIGSLVTAFNSMLADLDRDRAVREELTAASRAAEAQRVLVAAFPTPLIVTSIPDHRVLHANESALPWLAGVDTDPWMTHLDADARARFFQQLSDLDRVDGFEVRWHRNKAEQREAAHLSKSSLWALLSARRLDFQGQNALLTTLSPISQIKQLEQRLQLWAKVFEASSESIVILDVERRFLVGNRAFMRAGGWDLEEVQGQTPDFLYADRHDANFYETVWQSAIIRGSWQGEAWLRRKNGETYPTWLVANSVRNHDGSITHLVASSVDMSEHKANEARIHHLAHHDVLTDLPNRSLCMERLRMAIEQAGRNGHHVSVVFMDLDRFKTINDSMGHHVGDALLRSVSRRLLSAVRAGDTVCRQGGDEFVIVLSEASSRDEIRDIVDQRILPLVRQPHAVEGVELHVSCSAGMAVFPDDGHDVDHLMRNADAAMYQAKAAGRNNAVFFTPELYAQAQERLDIENALRRGLERREFLLYYQPRIRASDGQLAGVEALIRWQHPDQGLVSPARFIPVAEESGLIVPVGNWVIDEACRQQTAWRAAGLGTMAVSINVSGAQLRDKALQDTLLQALTIHGVQASSIEIELTESILMDNVNSTLDKLLGLKSLGVSLAIDDFGTGYSSLNYLHQFPIDKLKIDQSFVRDMLQDPADRAITQAIVGLGHTLGLSVVAEGVEEQAQAELLRGFGCDDLQGYLFGRPMPVAEFEHWCAQRRERQPGS